MNLTEPGAGEDIQFARQTGIRGYEAPVKRGAQALSDRCLD
jgi:hypothetical protein